MKFLSKNKDLFFKVLLDVRVVLVILSILASIQSFANNDFSISRPATEYAQNFGIMYSAQWAFYVLSQEDTIDKHGSFKNWIEYPTQPDFDKDSFDYNIFKHSLAGNYYYLFYRHQGYSEMESFAWTFLSSLAFEFTIETVTEKPSFQDIYQTPIYGTIVGMGSERLSQYLLDSDATWMRVLGYVVNPFNLLGPHPLDVSALPIFDAKAPGFVMSWRF
ncbi:hypothetical protein AZI86_01270 [Bdellovibrio bacteriovorus]|uniref:DUF3943 domain-containing protein n=1 Tax=Bdellovibrio bacteriovorus TaxID=959 RepID=A0A150WMY5_BDEBC|nr:DUF3943 domain-containing protein [Bdellovibrio bacteriovorus]KYG65734.1 hypothetical protein AZI86_01270 [Bdellovibrio bacteriovorus]